MLFSAAIDTVIGLLLVYLTLSLICTGINEAIAGVFRLRARNLFNEVSRALGDKTIRDAFWKNGLIRSLSRGEELGPSAIPNAPVPEVTRGKAPSYLENKDFALALIATLRGVENMTPAGKIDSSSPLPALLATLGIDATTGIDETKKAIEEWFDQVMDRASGVYKRWMSLLTFAVALTISVATNADTLQIARALWQDDAVRAAVIESATRLTATDVDGNLNISHLSQISDTLPLPLGWSMQAPISESLLAALSKIMGLVLTAFALSLGAPFWFDLLSRFVSIRNSGPTAATGRP